MDTIIEKEKVLRSNADGAWKDMLEIFLPDAIKLCFPKLNDRIDWAKKWEFLDQEFRTITSDSAEGDRLVDKLIRVFWCNGNETWVLVHIEIQGNRDNSFSKRMFIYHYRIYDKFGQHPVSCTILTDESKTWYPHSYQHNDGLGCRLLFEFHIFKVMDMLKQREILEESSNPFACIILAQMNALEVKNKSPDEKFITKFELTKRLYSKGFAATTVRDLYHFIDYIIRLPKSLEIKYNHNIHLFEETNDMRYVSTMEKLGIEKGIQQGLEKGIQQGLYLKSKEIALRLLAQGLSKEVISDATGLDQNEIALLIKHDHIT